MCVVCFLAGFSSHYLSLHIVLEVGLSTHLAGIIVTNIVVDRLGGVHVTWYLVRIHVSWHGASVTNVALVTTGHGPGVAGQSQ